MVADRTVDQAVVSSCASDVETIKGEPGSEQDIAGWADEAEQGHDAAQLRKRGRKPAGDGPVPVRLDEPLLAALSERAERDQVSRSAAMSAAIHACVA